jgi:enterochelin esterase-like enzyme
MRLRGKLIVEEFRSRCLVGNALRDDAVRETPVYLPEGYSASEEYPLIIVLSGFTGGALTHLNWSAWGETLPERIERLISEQVIPPSVVMMPDCFTRLGGSQYINSSATGDYEDYVCGELLPWMRKEYHAGLSPDQTVLVGKSSGGYGAFVLAARHPELFGWALVHSADSYFEYGYLPGFPQTLKELRKHASPLDMIALYGNQQQHVSHDAINTTGMSACYSPNPESPYGFDYPFDLETGELREDVWARWLSHDPVRLATDERIIENLKKLSGLYIECGLSDEFHLQWGARILSTRLTDAEVPHTHVEFEGGHFGLQWRYDESLKWWSETAEG